MIERHGSLGQILNQVLHHEPKAFGAVNLADWDAEDGVRLEPIPLQDAAESSRRSLLNAARAERLVLSVGQLEAFPNPIRSLRSLVAKLSADDVAVFLFSDIQHVRAEIGTQEWERLIGERNAYLDTQTAFKALFRAGFRGRSATRLRRTVSLLEWVQGSVQDPVPDNWRRRILKRFPRAWLRSIRFTIRSSDVAVVAKARQTEKPLISVLIPVLNEAATIATVVDSALRLEFEGAQVEVVIVESNSTDGSREIVQGYAKHPRVTCIFEDKPKGKGHATRLALDHARGDVFVIQDADLEYDFEDYHSLIEPIVRGREAFTLGSRHGGRNRWKLRRFTRPFLTKLYNIAHVAVTAYINMLFSLRLRDPQTMFKVFRSDCIEGIEFFSNYFDFDYELLLKIVRKGYKPLEIPVNYRSRSHAEGKKFRMWRDGPLGLWMITKLRFAPLASFLKFGEPLE
ncbi:MAG: glycosyltransferase family 2 protein [Chthoniobacterales bacterium]